MQSLCKQLRQGGRWPSDLDHDQKRLHPAVGRPVTGTVGQGKAIFWPKIPRNIGATKGERDVVIHLVMAAAAVNAVSLVVKT